MTNIQRLYALISTLKCLVPRQPKHAGRPKESLARGRCLRDQCTFRWLDATSLVGRAVVSWRRPQLCVCFSTLVMFVAMCQRCGLRDVVQQLEASCGQVLCTWLPSCLASICLGRREALHRRSRTGGSHDPQCAEHADYPKYGPNVLSYIYIYIYIFMHIALVYA